MATGGQSQPDFPVKTRQKASSSPFRDFSPGARPLSTTDDSLFGNANGRGRSQTMGPSISSPQQFLRSKSLRNSREKSKKVSDSGLNFDRPNSGPSELIHHPDDSEGALSEVVYKQWKFNEVVDILKTGLVTLPGGRDRRGGAIIVVTLDEKVELSPFDLGKTLVYLSQVPDDVVRGLKFTVILDGRSAQVKDVQNALKTMQLTFCHYIDQAIVLKPKGLMQRFKSSSNISGKKAKTTFSVVVLDSHSDLWQNIGINQVPGALNGNLVYDHQVWMDAVKILEELYLQVRVMLDDFEALKSKMDNYVLAPEVYSAHLMLKEHVEINPMIDSEKMSQIARTMQNDIGKLRMPAMHPAAFTPTKHPDFVVKMVHIETLFAELNDLYTQVNKLWKEKSELLNQCLQLRIFEDESDKFVSWICSNGHEYLLSQTAVGMTTNQAQAALRDHEHNCKEMMEKEAVYSRVYQMGQRLLEADNYGIKEIGVRMDKLKVQWEDFAHQLKRWTYLFQNSVEFHRKAQDFADHMSEWYERCRPFINPPETVTIVERLLREHSDMRKHYKQELEEICYFGNKMTEIMKEPILLTVAAKQPAFVASMRHVREAQHHCMQEESELSKRWQKHNDFLQKLHTLKKFSLESSKVKRWLENQGCNFLTAHVDIGKDSSGAQKLLNHHDHFESSSVGMFTLCHKLINESKELSAAGKVDPDLMEDEVSSLEIAFDNFINQLDERREIILMAKDLFMKFDHLFSLFSVVCETFPCDAIPYTLRECDEMTEEFEKSKNNTLIAAGQVREAGQKLKERMKEATINSKRCEVFLDYNQGLSFVEKKLIEVEKKTEEVDRVMSDRETILALCTQLRRFESDCRKFKGDFWYWLEVESSSEAAETLMNARLQQETFVRHQQSHLTRHRDLLSAGEQLAVDLDPHKDVITVSEVDRTPGSAYAWVLVGDLRKFLINSEPTIEQLKDKFGKTLNLEMLKGEGKKVSEEVTSLVEDLLSVPGIGDSIDSVQKLQNRVNSISEQLQTLKTPIDTFKSKSREVSSSQPAHADKIAEIMKSLESGYQEALGLVRLRQDMLGCALSHFRQHLQFLAVCTESEVVFTIDLKDTPGNVASCEQEQKIHLSKKDRLMSEAASAEASSALLLAKMDEWSQLVQGRQTKLDEGFDQMTPLPAGVNSSQTSLSSRESNSTSNSRVSSGSSWGGIKRHSASELMSTKTVETRDSSHTADRNSWGSSSSRSTTSQNRSSARWERSSSVSHSYSASRKYTSPQPFAAKRRTPSAAPPSSQKHKQPSQAPNSDPLILRRSRVTAMPVEEDRRLRRHGSEESMALMSTTKDVHQPLGKQNSSPVHHNPPHQHSHNTTSVRGIPLSRSADQQLSQTVFSKCVSWDETDRSMVFDMIAGVKERTGELLVKWQGKQTILEDTLTWLHFKMLSDEILHWHDDECVSFMTDCSYGDSIDDVEGLIGKHQAFVEGQMPLYFSKVQRLISWSQDLSKSSTVYRQLVQSSAVDVSAKWRKAVDVATNRKSFLQEALTFHVNLFEANNWCSKTHNFLDEMERRLTICEESSDARELCSELEGYVMFTRGDQLKRVDLMVSTADKLDSQHLKELAQQVETSTKEYCFQYEKLKDELEKRERRLLQIEKEQDEKSRAAKQRDRVVDELLETERVYTATLTLTLRQYMPILLKGEDTPEVVRNKAGTIFGNLETVEEYHRNEFLPSLEACNKDCNKIAELFSAEAQRMTNIYVGYCGGKSKSETVIIDHRPFFDQLKVKLGSNESLSSYLIRPIQRITKYPLMMKESIRYTEQAGQDPSKLIECYKALEAIPKRTNDAVHLSALEDYDEPFVELGTLHNQGLLFMTETRTLRSTEKERQLFLFDRAILICRRDVTDSAQVHYSFRQKIDLMSTNVKLQELEQSDQSDSYKFSLILRSEHKMVFRATSYAIGREWVQNIRNVLQTHKLTSYSSGSPNRASFRDGRRRGAVFGNKQFSGGITSDSDENTTSINSPRVRNMTRYNTLGSVPTSFQSNKYIVTEDYNAVEGSGGLSVKKGDKIEVIDDEGEDLWLGRTLALANQKQGWISPKVLMSLFEASLMTLEQEQRRGSPKMPRIQYPLRSTHEIRRVGMSTSQLPSSLNPSHIPRSKSISPPPPPIEHQTPVSMNVEANATLSRTSKKFRTPLNPQLFRRGSKRGSKKKQNQDGSGSGSSTPVNTGSPRVSPRGSPRGSPRTSGVFDDVDPLLYGPATDKSRPRVKVDSQSTTDLDNISVDSDYTSGTRSGIPLSPLSNRRGISIHPPFNHDDERSADYPGRTKIGMLIKRLRETESTYIKDLLDLIKGYMKKFLGPDVPESLKENKKLLFGNIRGLNTLHAGTFVQLLQESGESHEEIADSFLELQSDFEAYSSYLENAPRAAALLWGPAKIFAERFQEELKAKKSLPQYLSVPIQRLAMYDYYLEEMLKTAEQYSFETTHLKRAHRFIRQLRERGGDTSQLGLIVGYEGNIYSNGNILKQDNLVLVEGLSGEGDCCISRVFLCDQKIFFTRSLDGTRVFEYIDSLPLSESLLVDPPRDKPMQFTIADFRAGEIGQCYRLETPTAEMRDEWVGAIQDSLAKQLQILHAVRQNGGDDLLAFQSPSFLRERRRKISEISSTVAPDSDSSSISEEWDGKDKQTAGVRKRGSLKGRPQSAQERLTVPLPALPVSNVNTYIVKQDWSFEDDFEVIPEERMSPKPIRKGQVFEILEQDSYWWKGRLVKDSSPPGNLQLGKEVWLPSSHMDKKKLPPPPPRRVESLATNPFLQPPKQHGNLLNPDTRERSTSFTTPSMVSSLDSVSIESSTRNEEYSQSSPCGSSASLNSDSLKSGSHTNVQVGGKVPVFSVPASTLNVPLGSKVVKLLCTLEKDLPGLTVRWFHNGQPLSEGIHRVPMRFGANCTLDLVCVRKQDAGNYVCMASIGNNTTTATVDVVVTSPPGPPSNVTVEYVTEACVALSWTPPTDDGGAPITKFTILVMTENDELISTQDCDATEVSCVLENLDPSTIYLFRVRACNELGPGEPSMPSAPVALAIKPLFQLRDDQFSDCYDVVKVIARGRYSVVQECKHKKTGVRYATKKYLKSSLIQEWTSSHSDTELEEAVMKRVEQELVILLSLSHPCFPAAYEGFSNHSAYNIVTEYIEGRSLLDYIIDKDTLQESLVMDVCVKLLNGLQYLHSKDIAHLDVLPENIMAIDSGVVPELKLVGFGNASYTSPSHPKCFVDLNRVNVEFSAPELIEGQAVSTATDIWSVGVLLYVILTGLSPFAGSNKAMTMSNISNVKLSLPQQYFSDVSPEAKDLIKQLLVKDESKRLTASGCLEHPWLKVPDASGSLKSMLMRRRSSCNKLDMSRLKVFNASRAWKASLHSKKRRSLGGMQQNT